MKKTFKAFSAGELSEEVYGRYDLDKHGTGCRILKNWIIMAQGGVYKRPGTRFAASAGDETRKVRLIPFRFSTIQAYVLEFGHEYMRVYRNGGLVLESDQAIAAASQANPCNIQKVGHGLTTGDEVFISGVGGMIELNNRQFRITVVNPDNFTLDGIDSSSYTAFTSGGTFAKVFELATTYTEDELFEITYAQTADILTLAHRSHAPAELTRTGHTSWTLTDITFAPSVAAPASPSATNSTGTGSETYKYKITAVVEQNTEESLPTAEVTTTNDLGTPGNENTISYTAVTDAVQYNIYKDKSGVFGYIGTSETTSFIDDNIEPDVTDTPPRANNPFPSADNFPGVVGFSQQRRVFASTNAKPDTIWMSKAGLYSNFSKSIPNKDDDSFEFSIASGEVNAIQHILGFRDLLTMTDSEEWKIYSTGVLSPTTVAADPETSYGTDVVPPLKIGNIALFSALFGTEVRDYSYTFEADGYDGNDVSVLSRHLLKDAYIVDWAFAKVPDNVVWAVLSDGTLCTLTYLKEHRVWGWARHETKGTVESVAVVPDKTQRRHVPYFLINRTVDGQTRRYVETLEKYIDDPMEDAFFVDSGLTYDGSETDTITGLWHLEGETVKVYADGNVIDDEVVSNGTVTLSSNYSVISVGLGTDYELQPMAPESDQGKFGATKGDPKQIKTIDIEVIRTRGLFFGQGPEAVADDTLNELSPKFTDGDMANSIEGHSGILEIAVDPHWNDDYVAPYIFDNYPVPGKILTLTPNYETN